MNELQSFKENMAFNIYGRYPAVAKSSGQCVKCGEFNLEFSDEVSRREYGISVLCQCCQDGIFGTEEE